MIQVNDTMLDNFYKIMDRYDEFLFGDREDIRKQLETCLNTQGYWSGCSIRVFYDSNDGEFTVRSRF